MWHKLVLVLYFAICLVNCISIDDAKSLLNNLNQFVVGNIAVAKLKIGDFAYEQRTFTDNSELRGEFDLMEHDQRIKTQLMQIKQLSTQQKLNVTLCLDEHEDKLQEMVPWYYEQVDGCLATTNVEAAQINDDGIYRVDIFMTNVYQIEFQLAQCSIDDDQCVSGIVDNIDRQSTEIPLRIELEVKNVNENIALLQAKMQTCVNNYISEFSAAATEVVFEIFDCINLEQ